MKNNVPVLYSGTGCQIAGLKSYLGKDFESLYTVEVACHGVPAPGLFIKYIDWLENKYNTKIAKYTFRNKVKHKKGEHYTFAFEDMTGRKFYKYSNEDPFYAAFLKGKTLRDTCYHCKYKGAGHTGDILLCDFWGIEKVSIYSMIFQTQQFERKNLNMKLLLRVIPVLLKVQMLTVR